MEGPRGLEPWTIPLVRLCLKIPHLKRYHAQEIRLKGQYSAVKLLVAKVLRKKINKPLNDKMLTLLVLNETLQAHKSKRIRKIIYLSS